ncbi:MAG TPA: CaiB/BaiF CoA-transferase family protein [Candidatus Methylomirabilis sp.]|nr:CaiB/BaiF CoA-transferase family protein [Candidatus Methylomirabilis sp.]HSC70441.1 CaiB/BaiF CoA-transferase family protein [Candidatus Methylomirabilis sp.]
MSRALEGLRVVDLSHVLAAPTTSMYLADLGAEVIHIEREIGDDAREFGPFIGGHDKNRSGYFISLNRNKKSLVLDLKSPQGREILRELIRVSDVVLENYRPDAMEKLGFGWENLQKINPRVIYCSICGFGHDSLPEYANRPAYDMVAQAYSGLMSITGPEGGPPCRVGSSVGDLIAGLQATIGILAALRHRQRTGRGQYVDIAMVDGLFSVLENAVARYVNTGDIPGPLGGAHPSITPFQGFRGKDGQWVIAAIGNDKLWVLYCELLDRLDLIDHPKFKTNPLRCDNRKELIPILEREMAKKTAQEWCDLFEKHGIPYSPINNLQQICEDPHIAHRKMLVEIDQPLVGKMQICASPLKLSETPGEVYAPAPMLGQHSEEILRDVLGFPPEKIAQLKATGVIGTSA